MGVPDSDGGVPPVAHRSAWRRRALLGGGVAVGLAAIVAATAFSAGALKVTAHSQSPSVPPAATTSSTDPLTAVQSPSPSPSPSPSALPSATVGPVGPGQPAAHGGSGGRLRQVDGGTQYYAKFKRALPTDPSFFPIGVWFESVTQQADTDKDRDAGLNTYVQLTSNSDLGQIRGAGMYAIPSDSAGVGAETVGYLLADEADMWGGPGSAAWTGNSPGNGDICQPASAQCGYTIEQKVRDGYPKDGRFFYTNYGKGVTFWESDSDAARFVNQFQDVVSVDTYWFTDPNICGATEGGALFGGKALPADQCRHASNYGRTVDRVRSLVSPAGSKPVWGFVEVGHPASESDAPSIKPAQITAAVWSSIIHGARGIIYFNHSFGGPCQTQHALREACYNDARAAVKQVNGQIKALAPVLNAPSADGVIKPTAGVDTAVKWHDGHFYVIAGANQNGARTATFSMPCVGDAVITVLNENRTLTAAKGAFSDRFADGNAVHVYRVDGGSSCGAY